MAPFTLPKLGFPYDALEPHINSETMRIHHDALHKGYVDKLNEALADYPDFHVGIEELLASVDALPLDIREAVKNNGGGHANHSFFWTILSPSITELGGELASAIDGTFGSFAGFKDQFTEKAVSHFSNGWVWLCADPKLGLRLLTTKDHESPITHGLTPLLTLDLWEHAYFPDFQTKREEYVKAFWRLVHWDEVSDRWDEVQTNGFATGEWRQAV